MTANTWSIRDYRAGDEAAIVRLFQRVFKKTMGPTESDAHWAWEYPGNPVGPQTIKLVWDSTPAGDRLVGQYAVSPRRVWVHDRERLAALSLDTMVDPDYGRQGIFSRSAEACYATMVERGFAFVFGFPNANSIGGFERRLSWQIIMPTPVLVKPLNVAGFVADKVGRPILDPLLSPVSTLALRVPGLVDDLQAKLRARLGRATHPVVESFDAFGPWVDEVWQRCRHHHRVGVIRDHAYLRWRFDARPQSHYQRLRVDVGGQAVGYAVLATTQRDQGLVCFVMDLVVDVATPGAHTALLQAIESRARAQRCAFVSAMVGPGSPLRPTMLRNAYLPLPERLFPQELHFGGRALANITSDELGDPNAWHLSWSDIDVL